MSSAGFQGTAAPQFSPFLTPIPGAAGKYIVVRPGSWEVIRYALYDSQPYPAGGATSITYFQNPVGSTRTLSDTNMQQAGNIPNGQMFLVEAIDMKFFPTTPTGVSGAPNLPAAFGAQLAANIINDAYIFWRSGNFRLEINQKPYIQVAPMMAVPPMQQMEVQGALADATTLAADHQSRIALAQVVGKPWLMLTEPLLLDQGQTFIITTSWPEGLQALTSAARIVITLHGQLFRLT